MYIIGGSNAIQALIELPFAMEITASTLATHFIQIVSYEGRILEPGNTNNIQVSADFIHFTRFHGTFFASFVFIFIFSTQGCNTIYDPPFNPLCLLCLDRKTQ